MGTVDGDLAYLKSENVYAHLGKVIDRVVAEKPKDACSLVEVLSAFVKEQAPLPCAANGATLESEEIASRVKALRQLDQAPAEEGAPIQVCAIPDFTEDAETLSWTGLGLGEAEAYQVMCSLRNLAANQKDGLNKLRFWGKVLGTEADYYVAEAQRDGGGDDEADPDAEASGTGANVFTYFVTNDLAAEWRRLPDIKPKEVIAARAIKRLVTGNAGSKVITHPYFDGKEEVYLRAQIARITADTTICPKGFLQKEEDGENIEENAEFVCPAPAELMKKEAWTHMQPHILLNGRTTHKEIPEGDTPEEIAEAEKLKEEQEADPAPQVLRGLHEDGFQWSVKQAGDPTLYRAADPALPLRSSVVVYARSLSWPGAVCAVRNGKWVNFYVGYGLAAVTSNFFPNAPPDVQEEPEDPGEVEEPQGSEEPPAEEG